MKYSFREFLELDQDTQTRLGSFQVNEDLSGNQKEKKMKELEKKLKSHDYFFHYSDDGRSYKKGQKEQDEIRKLVDEIGEDGLSLYKQYLKQKGLMEDKTKPRLNPDEKEKKEQKSIFPEQNVSTKNIQLGYGEQRPVDGRSKHGFVDTGNLYYNQPQYVPPSKQRKKRYE